MSLRRNQNLPPYKATTHFKKLPILDALRTPDRQEVVLRVKLYKRRKRGILLSLGEPFPDNYHPRKPAQYKNFVLEALQVKAFMAAHPEETYLSAAPKLNLDRKRVAKLLKIANNLPGNLITELSNCNDPKTLQRMKFNRLLRLASQRTLKSDSLAPLASA